MSAHSRRAFSLIELLVVTSIVSVLIGLLLPAVQSAREAARMTHCKSNLRQLGLAVLAYEGVHKRLPMGNDAKPPMAGMEWWGEYNFSLFVRLLPYLEEDHLYEKLDRTTWLYAPTNVPVLGEVIEVLQCPSEPASQELTMPEDYLFPAYDGRFTAAFTSYVGSVGSRYYCCGDVVPKPASEYYNGVFWEDNSKVRLADVTDGASKTLLFGEHARGLQPDPSWGWWTSGWGGDTMFVTFHPINKAHAVVKKLKQAPAPISAYDTVRIYGGVSSYHDGGVNFCFLDGSVRTLTDDTESWDLSDEDMQQLWDHNTVAKSPKILQRLSTRNGGDNQ
jgi:prepilin-type N-terminal cleavage/methylation domain-containing protein/prepilin-type processing-associated H-X9-DG protein